MKKISSWLFLSLVFVVSLVLRLSGSIFERDYWYDEAFTGILLKADFFQMNDYIFRDVHPPLYYWLVEPWSFFFNYSVFGIRSFSLLFGLLTVFSVYWIGRKMFSEKAATLVAIITAISPFAIEYSQEARMYSLFGFLFLWSFWFFYRALEEGRRKDWILWGIFAGLSFYTHYLSLFFFVIFYLAYVFYRKIFSEWKWFKSFLAEKNFWLGVGVIAIFFFSWVKVFASQMKKGNLGWIDVTHLSELPQTMQIFFFGHPPGTGGVPSANAFRFIFDGYSVGLIALVLVVIFCTYLWSGKIKQKEIFLLSFLSFGTLVFLIFLSHLNIKLYVARYFMPAAVLIYLLVAGVLLEMKNKKSTIFWTVGVYVFLLLMLGPVDFSRGWNDFSKSDFVQNNEIIISNGPFQYTSSKFYFGQDRSRYFHMANPEEDFSGWVVVGNENKLLSLDEVKDYPEAVIVDEGNCLWEGLVLEKVGQFDRLSVCKFKD